MGTPYQDFDKWEREQYEFEQPRPVCAYCGQHIMDERCYKFDNGDFVCPDCLEDYLKRETDLQLELAVETAEQEYKEWTEEHLSRNNFDE